MKNRWIFRQIKRDTPSCRIFFFHHAGGTALLYKNWEKYISSSCEPVFVQLPMRANRMADDMPDSIQELARDFIKESMDLFDIPCMFFGHSMGAQVAYEVANQLSQNGIEPAGLFISACEAPNGKDKIIPYGNALEADRDVILEILRDYDHMLDDEVLEDEDFLEYYLPIVRKDFYLSDIYRKNPDNKLECDIQVFAGTNDNHVDYSQCFDWEKFTKKDFEIYELPGDHFYFDTLENMENICNKINKKVKMIQEN